MEKFSVEIYKKERDDDFISSFQKDFVVREAFNLKGLKEITFNKDSYTGCLVARTNSKKCENIDVGFIYFYFCPTDMSVYVSCIGTKAEYRGHGIGSMLLDEMEIFAKFNWPYQKIYAFTLENPASEHLFESAGFSNYGEYQDFVFINGRYKTQRLYVKLNKKFKL